jgi:hypothetical protein
VSNKLRTDIANVVKVVNTILLTIIRDCLCLFSQPLVTIDALPNDELSERLYVSGLLTFEGLVEMYSQKHSIPKHYFHTKPSVSVLQLNGVKTGEFDYHNLFAITTLCLFDYWSVCLLICLTIGLSVY